MNCYKIEGGIPLIGEIEISGSKNATLPVMAATILNRGISILKNVPDISDVNTMCAILESLGCVIERKRDIIIVDAQDISNSEIPPDLMREMRSSIIITGALIARMQECVFTYPRRVRNWCTSNQLTLRSI